MGGDFLKSRLTWVLLSVLATSLTITKMMFTRLNDCQDKNAAFSSALKIQNEQILVSAKLASKESKHKTRRITATLKKPVGVFVTSSDLNRRFK